MKHLKVFENFEELSKKITDSTAKSGYSVYIPDEVKNKDYRDIDNYMFFANLENIIKMAQNILSMDKNQVDDMLTKKHDWATDHVSSAKENLEDVHDWLSSQNIKEGAWLDFKKTFSFDKYFNSIQDMWNDINNAVHKKYPQLKNVDRNGPGFTNGGREFRLKFENFDSVKRKVSINGENVDWDNVIDYVFKLLKKESLVLK